MLDIFLQNGYWFMLLQVVVTMLIFPILNFKRMLNTVRSYSRVYYPNASPEIDKYTKQKIWLLIVTGGACFCLGLFAVLYAFINVFELFNWDNQAGLIVLCLIGFIPIFSNTLVQQGIFKIFKKYAGSKRTASLKPQTWRSYFPLLFILLILLGNIFFVATTVFFSIHPFEGFAGFTNLLGLLLLNTVFAGVCYTILNNSKMASIKDIAQREAVKAKAIKINLIIWIVALFNLGASLWLSGLELKDYGLVLQSVYIQILLFLTAYSLAPAKPVNEHSLVVS